MQDGLSLPAEHAYINLLIDFYSQLLPPRAREVLSSYYQEDLSLMEIAENNQISRQAVHDRLRQGIGQLKHYEDVLGLARRQKETRQKISRALTCLEEGDLRAVRIQLEQMLKQM